MYILSLEAEGFRLEGFDGQTPVLLSMDPLLDLGGEEGHSKSTQKKAEWKQVVVEHHSDH